eukprot:TRINITY_DN2073_c0_g3_i4.p1 TRINITY_DN2073_c0_g3~~TRINITY_DN2073_c0_g3_i4.p1  ORF type:complete len:383 (+),score=65.80 TRINITY_DN2073_c0_g3_i4:287-1435(+)
MHPNHYMPNPEIMHVDPTAGDLIGMLYKQLDAIRAQQQGFFMEISKRFEDLEQRQMNLERFLVEGAFQSAVAAGTSSTPSSSTNNNTPIITGRKRASAANLASNIGALVASPLSLARTPGTPPYPKRVKGLVEWTPRQHIKAFWRSVIFPQTRNPKEDELLESLANTFSFPKNGDTIQVARSKGLGTIRKCRHTQNLQALNICGTNRYSFINEGANFALENFGEDDATRGSNIVKRKVEHCLRLDPNTPLQPADHNALWERASNNQVNDSPIHKQFSALLLEIWEEYRQEIKLLDIVKHHTDRAAVKQKYFDYLLSPEVDSMTHPCASWIKWQRPENEVEVDEVEETINAVSPPTIPSIEEGDSQQQTQTQPSMIPQPTIVS